MTILTFPAAVRRPSLVSWRPMALTQVHTSPFDGSSQTLAMPGARWRASVSWNNLPLASWRILGAFVASLGGRAGRFTFGPPQGWRRATSTITGPVLVNGAGQTGSSLAVDGLPNSVVVFEIGDWISWPNAASRPQLHQITAQATSNGSGQATLAIVPPLRGSPADNAVVTTTDPLGVFMLADDEQGESVHSGERPDKASISLDIMEALR